MRLIGLLGLARPHGPRRADASTPRAPATLFLYAEGFALALAGLSVLAPPIGLLGVAFLIWLLLGGRRREGEKYAGLRSLRCKLVLCVIDGLVPAVLERAVAAGRAPVLAKIIEEGTLVSAGAVAAFPSVTPVCAATIATGVTLRTSTTSRR